MATIKITKDNFETEILKSDKPVLIDFWAEWCGPCRMVGPIVEEVSNEATFAKVGKINVDEEQELAFKYGIMSIPTLMIMKNGEVVDTLVGLRPKDDLINALKKAQ